MLRLLVLSLAAALLASCAMGQYPMTGFPVSPGDPVQSMPVPPTPRL